MVNVGILIGIVVAILLIFGAAIAFILWWCVWRGGGDGEESEGREAKGRQTDKGEEQQLQMNGLASETKPKKKPPKQKIPIVHSPTERRKVEERKRFESERWAERNPWQPPEQFGERRLQEEQNKAIDSDHFVPKIVLNSNARQKYGMLNNRVMEKYIEHGKVEFQPVVFIPLSQKMYDPTHIRLAHNEDSYLKNIHRTSEEVRKAKGSKIERKLN